MVRTLKQCLKYSWDLLQMGKASVQLQPQVPACWSAKHWMATSENDTSWEWIFPITRPGCRWLVLWSWLFSGFWCWWVGTRHGLFWLCDKFQWKPVHGSSACSAVRVYQPRLCWDTECFFLASFRFSKFFYKTNFVGTVLTLGSRSLEVQLAPSSLRCLGALLVQQKFPEAYSCPFSTRCCTDTGSGLCVRADAACAHVHGEETRTILYDWKRVILVSCSTHLL